MDSAAADAQQQLEDYVRGRITAFAKLFAAEVAPSLSAAQVERLTERILSGNDAAVVSSSQAAAAQQNSSGAAPSYPPPTLVYKHDCRALGCRDLECLLCQFNPERVCERNFQKKYLVGDLLKAKCGAPIRVELVDRHGNMVMDSKYSNMEFELNIVDGIAFKERGGEVQQLTDRELRGCIKYTKKEKAEPLLCYKSAPSAIQRIVVRLVNGVGTLPELTVTESSEALLAGRRPPFRLVTWMMDQYGLLSADVHYGVSNEFVVATRRVRQANKVEIPLMDDPVGKVEHIGRETMKKLADLRVAALESGLPEVASALDDRTAKIETVGQFQQLLQMADTDTQLRKNLQMILKLPKDKWEETAAHAMSAVVPDFRRRVWYPPGHNVGLGLVFNCKYGAPMMNQSVSLAQNAEDGNIKVIAEDQLDPASLDILRELKATAVKRWAEPHHPGWGIFRETDPAAAAATAAATAPPTGPFGNAHDAAAAAAAAAAQTSSWGRMPSGSSLGGRASSMSVDPAAAAALPVPAAAMKTVRDLSPATAAAPRGVKSEVMRDPVPSVGSKRTADEAGLDHAAAAVAAVDGSSKGKQDDHDDLTAAAALLAPSLLPPSSAAAAASSDAASAAAAAVSSLPLGAALPSLLSSSNPLKSNLGSNAIAVIQAAAAAMAAAQASGVPASEVVAKFTEAINAGMQEGRGSLPLTNSGSQKTVLQPPRVLPLSEIGVSVEGYRDTDVSGLTGLDAVAAAAAAAEAEEAAEKLQQQQQRDEAGYHNQQQQQQHMDGDQGLGDLAAARLSPTAIAAAIVKRLAGSSRAAAAVLGRDVSNGHDTDDHTPHWQQQQQQQRRYQQNPQGSVSNRSSGSHAGLATAAAAASKQYSVSEVAALAAASMQRMGSSNQQG